MAVPLTISTRCIYNAAGLRAPPAPGASSTEESMLAEMYLPVVVMIAVGVGLAVLFLLGSMFLGPKASTAEKLSPFECGSEPIGSPRVRFTARFYPVAILFLVFDIEAAFIYPWAVSFKSLSVGGSLFGFIEMLVFLAVLVLALVYAWRKRAIGWE
jgi:NADH-quinone oxidoreductase subunit A